MLIKFAILLEKISNRIKKINCEKAYRDFLKRHQLIDGNKKEKINPSYNSYEGTNISLIEKLIQSGEINKDSHIMDIGCGAGILLCYLHLQGFNHLSGIEIDEDLYNKCILNLNRVKCGTNRIHKADALHFDDIDDINVFYLFNPFYYPETYKEWVGRVKESWSRNNRHIKIILLFPTVSSIIAFKESGWLKKKCRIIDEAQVCSRCVNYMIFENEES